MSFVDPERERKRKVQAKRRREKPWVQWYRSRQWREIRARFLEDHPQCEDCGAEATVVDHIRSHRGDAALFWSRENWQPLCKSCHDRKTATEDGGFGNAKGRLKETTAEDGFPSDPSHPWNRG